MDRFPLVRFLLLAFVICGVVACGDDDDDKFDGSARVIDIDLDQNVLLVGQGTVGSARFSFSSDDEFDDDQTVVVVIHLPPSVRFREGTAEIDRDTGEDHDVGALITVCDAGDTYLLFDLDEDDLTTASNPSGDADAELKFTVDAVGVTQQAAIEATARNNTVNFTCAAGLAADASLPIAVQ